MKKPKVIVDYSHTLDNDIDQAADHIAEKMTGNTNFSDQASVDLTAAVIAANATYKVKLEAAIDGSKINTAEKNTAKRILANALHDLGTHINVLAQGDEVALKSTGFRLHEQPSPVGELPKPLWVKLTDGESNGEIIVKCAAVKGAKAFLIRWRKVNANNTSDENTDAASDTDSASADWAVDVSIKTSFKIIGLSKGTEYEVQIAAVGTDPTRNFSDSVFRVSQ